MDYWAGLELHVPDWVRNDRYDIEARTAEPATKDQMRLMMQSLLAERFKLASALGDARGSGVRSGAGDAGDAGAAAQAASGERRLRDDGAS